MPAALVPRLAVVDGLPTKTSGKVDRDALPWPLPPPPGMPTGAVCTAMGPAGRALAGDPVPVRPRRRDFFDPVAQPQRAAGLPAPPASRRGGRRRLRAPHCRHPGRLPDQSPARSGVRPGGPRRSRRRPPGRRDDAVARSGASTVSGSGSAAAAATPGWTRRHSALVAAGSGRWSSLTPPSRMLAAAGPAPAPLGRGLRPPAGGTRTCAPWLAQRWSRACANFRWQYAPYDLVGARGSWRRGRPAGMPTRAHPAGDWHARLACRPSPRSTSAASADGDVVHPGWCVGERARAEAQHARPGADVGKDAEVASGSALLRWRARG
jgi:hypothetical protein